METGLLLCTSVVIIGGLIAAVLFLTAYNPENRRRAALLRRARQDFEQAHGAEHLRLLQERQPVLVKRLARLDQHIARLQADLQALQTSEQLALQQAAERQLLTQRIHEIPGLGAKLQESLLQLALQQGLEQLQYAQSAISGIGDARQAAIDAWVARLQPALDAYLQSDFPEKSALQQQYAERRAERQARLADLAAQQDHWREIGACLQAELSRLSQVSQDQFAQALLEPGAPELPQPDDAIAHYLQGVIGEWQPLPDWFNELVDLRTP